MLARGATLQALRRQGLRVEQAGGPVVVVHPVSVVVVPVGVPVVLEEVPVAVRVEPFPFSVPLGAVPSFFW
jgi:hypothetical protein